MKKILFSLFCTGILFSFTGCDMLAGLLNKIPEGDTSVLSTNIFSLSRSKTDISSYTEDNSKVFVVQVNTGNVDLDSNEYESTLRDSSRSVQNSEDFFYVTNDIPQFVKDYRNKPAPVLHDVAEADYTSVSTRSAGDTSSDIPEEKEFYFPLCNDATIDDYVLATAYLKYESKYAYIYYLPNISWAEDEMGGIDYLSDDEFKTLGDKFDKIYEAEVNLVGSPQMKFTASNLIKTPSDNKITILVNDINCDSKPVQDNDSYVVGYFWANDFYLNTVEFSWDYTPNEDVINSNECEIIYVDSVLLKRKPGLIYSTLAHEFNHLLNTVNKEINLYHKVSGEWVTNKMNPWFTEMLSMVCEDLLFEKYLKDENYKQNSAIEQRIPYFCRNYNVGFTSWNSRYTMQNYGNTFAYGAFLTRNYGGADLIKEIATNNYVNEDAISMAFKELRIKDYLNNSSDATFNSSVADFALSSLNYEVKDGSGLHSFNLKSDKTLNGFRYIANPIDLRIENQSSSTDELKEGLFLSSAKKKDFLGAKGMLIQYAGEGINEISVTIPDVKGLDMYCIIQHFAQEEE
ncbi:MAG: hypothetical protein MJ181_06095 [Treponema sp.]|nr:hypothetical protein [Treponema sp.]